MRSRSPLLLTSALALLTLGAPACVPFVSPPLRVDVAGGTTLGSLAPPPLEGHPRQSTAHGLLQVRANAAPLGVISSMGARTFDVDAGYVVDYHFDDDVEQEYSRHGPNLRLSVYPKVIHLWGRTSDAIYLRLGLSAAGELLFGEQHRSAGQGGGITGAISVDISNFGAGDFTGDACGGVSFGEAGVGLVLSGSYRRFNNRDYGLFLAGLMFRLPAAVGVCVVTKWSKAVKYASSADPPRDPKTAPCPWRCRESKTRTAGPP